MADVDIDPFGNTNQDLKNQLMNIFLQIQLPQEDHQLGSQTEESKKLHSEENLKELNS